MPNPRRTPRRKPRAEVNHRPIAGGALSRVFINMPEAAQKLLIANKIKSPVDLRRWSMEELMELGFTDDALRVLRSMKGK